MLLKIHWGKVVKPHSWQTEVPCGAESLTRLRQVREQRVCRFTRQHT